MKVNEEKRISYIYKSCVFMELIFVAFQLIDNQERIKYVWYFPLWCFNKIFSAVILLLLFNCCYCCVSVNIVVSFILKVGHFIESCYAYPWLFEYVVDIYFGIVFNIFAL